MKKIVTILAAALLVLGWYQTIHTVFGKTAKYDAHVEAAEAYAKKEIFEDALTEFQAASAIYPNAEDIKIRIAETQLELGEDSSFVSGCEALVYQDNVNSAALKLLSDYYISYGKLEELVSMLKKLRSNYGDDDAVEELWTKYRGAYEELYYTYEELSPFYGETAVVGNEGKYGLINTQGENVFPQVYDSVTALSQEKEVASVSESGKWYYINTKIHKKIVPDEDYDYLGIISEEKVAAGKNGKFGFADLELKLLTECEWEAVSNFCGGIAAVQKDGAWALLGDDLNLKTDYIYEDILVDEAGFCSRKNRIFAKQKGAYYLLDESGNRVGELAFEDARPFGEDDMTAVCMDGAWGFINTDGDLVIPCAYEDAKTFAYGLAPVREDGVWGYVDTSGSSMVKPQFEDAYPFNKDGAAPVKDGNWFLIRLYALQ